MRVTLAGARKLALADNPELLAQSLDTSIARGNLRQARAVRFNPAAEVLAPVGSNGTEVSLSQELEVFGQRGVRVAARTAGFARAHGRVMDAARRLLGDVDRTFYRLISGRERALLADSVSVLNRRVTAIAERQLAAGEISRLDYNLAAIELGRSQARALSENREHRVLSREFSRLLGIAGALEVYPVLDSTQHHPLAQTGIDARADARSLVEAANRLSQDSLMNLAIQRRPDLRERKEAGREAAGDVVVAKRDALPNLVLRGVSEPEGNGDGRVLRGGVGISLPILNGNRGEIQARRATAEQAELQRVALETTIKTEVSNAISAYRAAAAEIEVLETTVLPPARQNRVLLESAYREGKVGLPVLLLIRNQVVEAEMEYWSAWLREREAFAALGEVTAANLDAVRLRDLEVRR